MHLQSLALRPHPPKIAGIEECAMGPSHSSALVIL